MLVVKMGGKLWNPGEWYRLLDAARNRRLRGGEGDRVGHSSTEDGGEIEDSEYVRLVAKTIWGELVRVEGLKRDAG